MQFKLTSLFVAALTSYVAFAGEPTPPAAPAAKPKAIVGICYDSAGKPISKGVVVTVAGRTMLGGERADYTITPDETGKFEQDLPDGIYKVWANVEVQYNGRTYHLPLASEDKKDMHAAYNSAKGIVKNFQWKLSGLMPNGKPNEYGSYWGVGILLFDADRSFDPTGKLMTKYPGSTVVVHLEPKGPLVDGSQGKAIDLETPSDALDIRNPKCKHLDIPLGDYKATAKLKLKNGKEKPLKIAIDPRVWTHQPAVPAAREQSIDWTEAENGGCHAISLNVSE